jgi:hypothetical protein
MRLLTTIATMLAQYHWFTATRHELEARSDRERGDITRLAWQETERRFPLPAATEDTQGFAKTSARPLDLTLAGQR